MTELVQRFQNAGVKVVLSGHEHQFQQSRSDGVEYLVSGGAGKLRTRTPDKFTEARTVSWAAKYHFLLITVDGKRMTVRAIGELNNGTLVDIPRKRPNGSGVNGEIVINLP